MSHDDRRLGAPLAVTELFPRLAAGHGGTQFLVGVLDGEGIGPDIVDISLTLLKLIEASRPLRFELRRGGKIGKDAVTELGCALTPEVTSFCRQLFEDGGALFCGPGGERFVYDLRREFDLYCKLVPIQPLPALIGTGPLRPTVMQGVDILIVRETTGGLYQGQYGVDLGQRRAWQRFEYSGHQVARIIDVAVKAAEQRRNSLTVITKSGGVPSISQMWEELACAACQARGVSVRLLEVDNACYQIIADPRSFDVVVAPNLFGDIVADDAALLLGSRGVSCSANYSSAGCAVYQTGHGAAHDLTGTDRANPVGQILALAMMLEHSFGLSDIAAEVRHAVDDVLGAGWRTADIAAPGSHVVGTRALGEYIAERLCKRLAAVEVCTKAS
jgi:3-isopropylmalate dehydrogenase